MILSKSKIKLKDLDVEVPFLEHMWLLDSITPMQREQYKRSGVLIGKAMWTVPPWFPVSQFKDILGENWEHEKIAKEWDNKEIDDYFTDGFLSDNEQNVVNLFSLLEKDFPEKYKIAIDEIQFAYNNCKYVLCANTLFTVIDGLTQDVNNSSSVCEKYNGKIAHENKGLNAPTIFAEIKSVNKFLDTIYKTVDFDNETAIIEAGNNSTHFCTVKILLPIKLIV
jgi:hypothetical protein